MPQRMGIMGGTFNPVHLAHLRAAEEAVEKLDLDTFVFIPAAVPPHKPDSGILPFEHRWEMLRLAIQGNPRFRLSNLEQTLSGKSYTVKTLTRLREELSPETDLYFLVGLDAFLEINTWWHYRELFRLARLVVVRRPGYREEELIPFVRQNISPHYVWNDTCACFQHPDLYPVHYLEVTRLDISSSSIRRLLAEKRSVRYLVPHEVRGYIKRLGLYRPGGEKDLQGRQNHSGGE